MEHDIILTMHDISKKFPGVQALKNVSLAFSKGSIHGLVGENGAGKSTLIKILAGIYRPDTGRIVLEGKEVSFSSPREAILNGISTVHQEFSLVPFLSVAENIFMGNPQINKFVLPSKKKIITEVKKLIDMLDFRVSLNTLISDLSVSEQQLVEIMRALVCEAKLLILDEPTASLAPNEVEKLFGIMRRLRESGTTIIFVSHRLSEVLSICDSATVMKDGEVVGTYEALSLTEEKLANLMVGREIKHMFPEHSDTPKAKKILQLENIALEKLSEPVDLTLFQGEILGLYGLEGQGQRELMRALAGLETIISGKISIYDKPIRVKNSSEAVKCGIVYVPPDRKVEGLALNLTVYENIGMAVLLMDNDMLVRNGKLRRAYEKTVQTFRVKAAYPMQMVLNLSGGTQQKVVLGRWFGGNCLPKVMLLDEPTRGVDVGTKAEIYEILRKLADTGVGVIIYSSDMVEMMGLCDRIIVFYDQKIAGQCNWMDFSEEKIMMLAAGVLTSAKAV